MPAGSRGEPVGPGGQRSRPEGRPGPRRLRGAAGDPAVEAVYIPLPNSMHREWAEASAAAGKHVLCEKPLAPSAADASAIAASCRAAGVVLMEAYMSPFPSSVPSDRGDSTLG